MDNNKSGICRLWSTASLCLLLLMPLPGQSAGAPDAITPDGGRYYGQLVDGKRHGKGRIEWDNGARYEGGFEKGLFSGAGRYQSSSSYIYEGNFKEGAMSGAGRYTMPDGAVYVGEFRNDSFNGSGRYEMANGNLYEGMFSNGMFEGKGKLTSPGQQYQGDFRKGQAWGLGELKYQDGRKYTGQFERNLYQGKGRYESVEGQIYEGVFDKGEFTGAGIYKRRDGARHEGGFLNWRPQGAGKYTDADGNVYEGTFVKGELTGAGHWKAKSGDYYEGEFRNWRFHGQGTYHYANGDEYKGGFANDLFEGAGTFVYAKPQKDGRNKETGVWHYGVLEDKEAEKQTPRNVETVLYNQRALLDKAYAGLAARESGRINMYLLAVGGDGSQEVFRRETEFVRQQFDRNYGTKGRSMVLVNSRTTVADYPMATVTSIRESLHAIASRMDKQKDILFLYLTSHGSKTHEFALGQKGMDLPDLPAAELGKLLKESGIRWKVVVVSACYSGGFIAPLKDDNTLVITASRADRTSFGCADENDFTYFGRAFFKESLPGAKSFDEAFDKTRTLVAKWEKEDFKADDKAGSEEHSEPQIHSPKPIQQYLQRWREQLQGSVKPVH